MAKKFVNSLNKGVSQLVDDISSVFRSDDDVRTAPRPSTNVPSFSSTSTTSCQAVQQDPPVLHDLTVSLEEVLVGCTKKMKITRKVFNIDGVSHRNEEKILNVDVKRGWKAGTKITFPNEGDRNPHRVPADVIFVIKDKPHPVFKREGVDIRYIHPIPLVDALKSTHVIMVPTLDHGSIPVTVDEIIKPETVVKLCGYGLPYPKEPQRRGEIILSFDIKFPDTWPENQPNLNLPD